MRHFLQYWKAISFTEGETLEHSASSQFKRVSRDDLLWIVTVRNYRLKLLGRIVVDKTVGQRAAERKFREKVYKAKFHVLARKKTVEELHEIDIHKLAPRLRFESKNDRLTLGHGGRINGQQLQVLRELTPASADLIAGARDRKRAKGRTATVPTGGAEKKTQTVLLCETETSLRLCHRCSRTNRDSSTLQLSGRTA